jgi:hypothetical protein
MIPINLGITFNKTYFEGQASQNIKQKVIDKIKGLFKQLNLVFHGRNVQAETNEFGSKILKTDKPLHLSPIH